MERRQVGPVGGVQGAGEVGIEVRRGGRGRGGLGSGERAGIEEVSGREKKGESEGKRPVERLARPQAAHIGGRSWARMEGRCYFEQGSTCSGAGPWPPKPPTPRAYVCPLLPTPLKLPIPPIPVPIKAP